MYGSIEKLKDMGTVCVTQLSVKAKIMPDECNPSQASSGWREESTEQPRLRVSSSYTKHAVASPTSRSPNKPHSLGCGNRVEEWA